MQLVQSSIGMEFVNALLEPLCGTMRRRLKPLPREPKLHRPTVTQNTQYLEDNDVLSETEAVVQQQIVHKRRSSILAQAPLKEEEIKSNIPQTPNEIDENVPLISVAPSMESKEMKADIPDTPTVEEEEKDDEKEELKRSEESKAESKQESSVIDHIISHRPFVFLVPKTEAHLFEQWQSVLQNIVLKLKRLENEEPKLNFKTENEIGNKILDSINAKYSYVHILENLSEPLLNALSDLKSAANITIEDVESSVKSLKFLKEAHKQTLNVFRTSTDPLVTVWSSALLIVTTFFTATNFLIITDEMDLNDEHSNGTNKKSKRLRKERSQILRILPQFDHILYELDERPILFEQLTKICKSSMFLTNNQWMLLDSILEFTSQLQTVQYCITEERINAIIASVLHQYNNGAMTANVRYTFPINYCGYFFTNYKQIKGMKEYYTQRAKVFMAQSNGYYIKGKYKEMKVSKTHKATFDNALKWNAMSNSEKILFFRVLANKSRLKSLTFDSDEFSDNGCLYLSVLLNGAQTLLLNPSDELLYWRLSKLLSSLHEQYLWDYIDYHPKLSQLIDTTLVSEHTINSLNECLQKLLRHFQQMTDWKKIKNSIPIDSDVFLRHQKKLYCLQRLYLSNCNISSIGCTYICDGLLENDSLKELILDNNKITDSGGKAIGKMLAQNVALVEVDLSYNSIDKNGFCAIIVGWQLNKKYSALKNLDLSHNKTKLRTLVKDRSIPVDVAVSIQELKESVKVASF